MKFKCWAAFLLLVLAGCSRPNHEEVYVLAASSMQDSLQEATALFLESHPDVQINLSFGGSNTLQTQIEEGFTADLFISAHVDPMLSLDADGFLACFNPFLENEVVLAVNSDKVESVFDLAQGGLRLIFAGDEVPIGIYTAAILEKIEADHPGFREAVLEQVISRTENVRQSLLKVSLGEADAAFVYRTDLIVGGEGVRGIDLPEAYATTGYSYLGLIANDDMKEAALAFYEFLQSEPAQEVFRTYGFK